MRNARPAEGPRSGAGGPRRAPGGGGLPIRRHGAPAAAVPPRYVAEVGLYARFPAHVQLPDHAVAHGRLLPKDPDLLGSSAGPRAVAELARMRWRDWRAYGGANGRSALAEMAVFAVALATASGSRATAWRSWPAATSARRRGISRSMGRGGGRPVPGAGPRRRPPSMRAARASRRPWAAPLLRLWRPLHKDGRQGPAGNDCATWGNTDDSAESARAPE